MIKKLLPIMFMISWVLMPQAFADHGHGKFCPHGYGASWHHMDLKEKFFAKAHFILDHQSELGLTEDQANQVRALKLETKKSLIKQQAEIEVFELDIYSRLWDDPVNVEEVNLLIDQKLESKKALAKTVVEAYAKLKAMLTTEQKTKMKEMWMKKK